MAALVAEENLKTQLQKALSRKTAPMAARLYDAFTKEEVAEMSEQEKLR